jgi:hypothetical protein
MTEAYSPRRRAAVALFAACIAIAVIAGHYWTATSSADTPALTGNFCTFNASTICMTMTWNGVAYGTPNRDKLALHPGPTR